MAAGATTAAGNNCGSRRDNLKKGGTAMAAEKRMTWNEIKERYPDQWLGLTDVEMEGANVRSGIIKYIGKSVGELTKMQLVCDDLISVYTTPDNLAPMGVMGYFG